MGRRDFKLDEFEYLAVNEGAVLLRVAGRWARQPGRCDLVATTRGNRLTLDALPQGPIDGATWRAAYSAPPRLLDGARVRFQLVAADGTFVSLPQPTPHSVGQQRKPAPAKAWSRGPGFIARRRNASRRGRALGVDLRPVIERERSAREAAERVAAMERVERERATAELQETVRRASGERARFLEWIEGNAEQRARLERALSDQHDRLERALEAERERTEQLLAQERERAEQLMSDERERVEHELGSVRTELDRVRAERAEACATAEERLLAVRAAGRRLARLRARIDEEVAARTRDARASEQEALEQASALSGRVAELEDVVGRLTAGIEDGERRLAQAEELAQTLRAAIERAERERPATPDLGGLRDAVDRRLERLAHLERQAEALRDAIHERMATAPSDPGQEQLFEAPVDDRHPVPA